MTIPHTVELAAVPVLGIVVALSYTSTEVLQILGALGVLIGIVGGVIVNILSTWRIEKKADARSVILEDVAKKSAVIEGHVNSEATALKAEIASLKKEKQTWLDTAAEDKLTERLAAQAAAITEAVSAAAAPASVAAAPTPLAVAPVAASLEHIDDSTKQIKKNTKRTDAAVQELKDK